MQMIFDDMTLEAIAGMVLEVQARENTSLPVLKEQLVQAEQGIQNMLNAIQQGIFTPSTKQRLEELEETKERLTVSILQEELQKPRLSKEQILFFLHRFRDIDTTKQEHRQRLVDSFVNAVYVYDDKIILTFNYQDGTETITLDDINGSDLEAECPPNVPKKSFFGTFFLFFFQYDTRRHGQEVCQMPLGLTLTLCGLGAAFLIPALILLGLSARRKRCCTAPAEALVTDLRARSSADDGLTFHPVYEYLVDGVRYTGTGAYLFRRVPRVGSTIAIRYDPDRPQRSYIPGYDDHVSSILGIVFACMGSIPILVCVLVALLT